VIVGPQAPVLRDRAGEFGMASLLGGEGSGVGGKVEMVENLRLVVDGLRRRCGFLETCDFP